MGMRYIVLACVAYTALLVAFIISVIKEFKILHGYPRFAELLPGPFVSDRYSWSWYFLMLNLARIFIIFLFLYTLIDLKVKRKRRWFSILMRYFLAFDVILWLFFLITSCFLCNNSFWPSASSLCNDDLPKWCTVMGDSYPERCPPSLPYASQCDLKPNVVYIRWIYFHIGFTLLDFICYQLNRDMKKYTRPILYTYE